jgi:hypothetical protein
MKKHEMTELLLEVVDEMDRQLILHPVPPTYFLHPITDPTELQIRDASIHAKEENDMAEKKKDHSWYSIIREENMEVFAESENALRRKEAIQCAALYLRLAKDLS